MMRLKKVMLSTLFVLFFVAVFPALANAAAPRAVTAVPVSTAVTLDVANGRTLQLGASVLPQDASQRMVWASANRAIAGVTNTGLVVANRLGTVYIGVRPQSVGRYSLIRVQIVNSLATPRAVSAVPASSAVTLDLADGRTLQLGASVLPQGASQRMVWASANRAIAGVTSTGLVVANRVGTVYIGVRPYSVGRYSLIRVQIVDSLSPKAITLPVPGVAMKLGDQYTLSPTVTPSDATQTVFYQSTRPAVAHVSQAGVVTARAPGSAYVYVRSTRNPYVYQYFRVVVAKPILPVKILITPATNVMDVGETLQFSASFIPSNANSMAVWLTGDSRIASISNTGKVTALKEGIVRIACRSLARPSVYTIRTLRIVDPGRPTKVSFQDDAVLYFGRNEAYQLPYRIEPDTARQDVTFSSDSRYVKVDETGKITTLAVGASVITVRCPGTTLVDTIKIVVRTAERAVDIPDKSVLQASDVLDNLKKIDAIRLSAHSELLSMSSRGTIRASEANQRWNAIASAFTSYNFAWTTPVTVPYWSSKLRPAYDFTRGRIYFGLPYIQCASNGNYANRRYNLAKAVSSGYFTQKASQYYEMTQKRLDRYYVGCDCSSFVSISIWGLSHSASYANTTAMATSSHYQNINPLAGLRPGDVLVKSGSHTVMFLYYTDEDNKQMMLIENGGGTVSCKTANVATYINSGYRARRPTKYV